MTIPLQITFSGFPHSAAVDTDIREKVATLESSPIFIARCHVFVEAQHQASKQGKLSRIRVELSVPDKMLVISYAHQGSGICRMIEEAFDSAAEQLAEYALHRLK